MARAYTVTYDTTVLSNASVTQSGELKTTLKSTQTTSSNYSMLVKVAIVFGDKTFVEKSAIIKIAVTGGSISNENYGVNRCAGNWIHWSPGASITTPCLVFTNGLTGTDVAYNRVKCTMTGKIDYAYKQNLDQVGI